MDFSMRLSDIIAPFNNDNNWFFAQPHSRGDTYLMCGLMEAFRQRRPNSQVNVIVKESHKPIAEMFEKHIERIIVVPDNELMPMCLTGTQRVLAANVPIALHPHFLYDGCLDRLTMLDGFSDKEMYAHLLGLPLGASLSTPVLKDEWKQLASNIANTTGIVPGKTVILIPDANSFPSPSLVFWTQLSERLARMGWTVITNLFGSNNQRRFVAFPGSIGIAPPLTVLLALADIAGWVISVPTGSLAILFMAQIKCKKTVIAVGPAPGETMEYNQNFGMRSAYPFASQRKCDGLDYEAQEFELSGNSDYARAIEDIAASSYASLDNFRPSSRGMVPLTCPCSPGDLLDRISILEIKNERLQDKNQLHYVKRELLHLRAIVARIGWGEAAKQLISDLKRENVIGWEGIDEVYGLLDTETGLRDLVTMKKKYRELRDANIRRSKLKHAANDLLGSVIKEEKNY